MISPEQLNALVKGIMGRFSGQEESVKCGKNNNNGNGGSNGNGNGSGNNNGNGITNNSCVNITPSVALVIAGLLGGVLEVTSILVDKDQIVQIVLQGSLKQKTELEKMLDQIGTMPFDEVFKALMGRL